MIGILNFIPASEILITDIVLIRDTGESVALLHDVRIGVARNV